MSFQGKPKVQEQRPGDDGFEFLKTSSNLEELTTRDVENNHEWRAIRIYLNEQLPRSASENRTQKDNSSED
jgi:hypothetical protein